MSSVHHRDAPFPRHDDPLAPGQADEPRVLRILVLVREGERLKLEISDREPAHTEAPMTHCHGRVVGTGTYHYGAAHPSRVRSHERPRSVARGDGPMSTASPFASDRVRTGMRLILAAFYFAAGIFHLETTDTFVAIVPSWVPDPHLVVLATGGCELAGALALLNRRLRGLAGIMLAIYAVCVFPANINQAVNHVAVHGRVFGWGYHVPRLAAQPVLIWWTLFCCRIVDWPWRSEVAA